MYVYKGFIVDIWSIDHSSQNHLKTTFFDLHRQACLHNGRLENFDYHGPIDDITTFETDKKVAKAKATCNDVTLSPIIPIPYMRASCALRAVKLCS